MRFLWESNAPWAGTGYGQQTKLMLPALRELGHDPQCFAFYGLAGGAIEYDGYKVWPNSDYETWGNDVIKLHVKRSESEGLITLMDLFILEPKIWQELEVPWAAWVPVDCEGIGSGTGNLLNIVDYPVAMSHFGAQQIREFGIEPFATIWHAVDTDTFKPMDKAEARDLLSLPQDAYVIGMVMANKGDRKQYPLQFKAVREFKNKHPEAIIYLHTEPTSAMGGWDMRALSELTGMKGSVFATNQYDTSVVPMTQPMMNVIYNSFDVLMNCSAGEGFGIPIVEAQACGVPVLTGNYTAMPEITQFGYTVESSGPLLGGHMGWQHKPDIEDMIYRLECVYRMASKDQGMAARIWVINNCSVPVIATQWSQVLEVMASEGKRANLHPFPAQLPKEYAND